MTRFGPPRHPRRRPVSWFDLAVGDYAHSSGYWWRITAIARDLVTGERVFTIERPDSGSHESSLRSATEFVRAVAA